MDGGEGNENAMVPPKMPTGLSIRQTVLDNNPDGEFDDSVGVMRTGSGEISCINVEIDLAFRAMMDRIDKFDEYGASLGPTTEMAKFSLSFAVFAAKVAAMGARAFGVYFRAFSDDGLGQIVDVIDPFRGIGQIISRTGHG